MKVTLAAIKMPDGRVWSVPRPGRHDAVVHAIYEATGQSVRNEIQGFLDEAGNFLTRHEAEIVARAAGQVTGPVLGGPLTSEDLWDSWRCGYDVNERKVSGGCGIIYERSKQPKQPKRTTTCPECGKVDALHRRQSGP